LKRDRALLVDIGNTRIKWARFDGTSIGRQHAATFAGWQVADFAREVLSSGRGYGRILVCSVAGRRVNAMVAAAARRAGGPKPEFVVTRRRAGGVTTAYIEPWRLGVDRFAMAIGAHRLAKGRAVCIASVGTALTLDLVDSRGLHRGGAILPAPPLMVETLLSKTNGIRQRAGRRARAGDGSLFARTTRAAIEQGSLLAAAAAIDRAAEEARRVLGGRAPVVLLTGGGAKAVAALVRTRYRAVPDLVLQGLAVLASEAKSDS
jgi:type III pantothenate kinase